MATPREPVDPIPNEHVVRPVGRDTEPVVAAQIPSDPSGAEVVGETQVIFSSIGAGVLSAWFSGQGRLSMSPSDPWRS